METLNNAARAAGFAMAGSEEIFEERKAEPETFAPESVVLIPVAQTRPQSLTEWVRGYLGSLGRRAPASPV